MAKKCQVSENYVKKMDGLAQKEGGWYQYVLCGEMHKSGCTFHNLRIDADVDADMQWELLQRSMHALFCCCCSGQIFVKYLSNIGQIFVVLVKYTEKRETARSRGLSIRCSEVFWKLPKNNKLSVLEVVKLGKSYNWLMHHSVQNMGYTMWTGRTHDKYRYDTHVKTCINAQHLHQSSITQFLSQMAWTIFHLR